MGADKCFRVHSTNEISDALREAWQNTQTQLDSLASEFNTLFTAITNDNKISILEKMGPLAKLYADLEGRYLGLAARATALGLSVTSLNAARTKWQDLLNSWSPAWNDYDADTIIFTGFDDSGFPSGWTFSNTNNVGLDGANRQISDSSGTQAGNVNISESQSGVNQYSVSWVIQKDTNNTTFPRVEIAFTGGTAKTCGFNFNTSTGATGGAQNLDGYGVLDVGDAWVAWAKATSNSNNTAFVSRLYPAFTNALTATSATVGQTRSVYVRSPRRVEGTESELGREYMNGVMNAYCAAMTATNKAISEIDATLSDIQVPGSGVTAGDGRNLPPIASANLGYKFTGAITYVVNTSTTATVSVAAGSLYMGNTISYNAMSVNVSTGTAFSVQDYWLYVDANIYTPGAHTLFATQNPNDILSSPTRMYAGYVQVNYALTPGDGGGGTSGGGGGSGCVVVGTHLPEKGIAGNVHIGDRLVVCDPVSKKERKGIVTFSQPKLMPCVLLETENGAELECSTNARIATEDGECLAFDIIGESVLIRRNGEYVYERIEAVNYVGMRFVQHITCEDTFFLAGRYDDALFLHHNRKPIDDL